jgi:hypothetical protein
LSSHEDHEAIEILHRRRHLPIFEFSPSFQNSFQFSPPWPSISPTFTNDHVKRFVVELTLAIVGAISIGATQTELAHEGRIA